MRARLGRMKALDKVTFNRDAEYTDLDVALITITLKD